MLACIAARVAYPCTTHLVRFGPIDPDHGFPAYYVDANNLALQPCLDLVCDPALELPDPGARVSFPGNFPAKFFYHRVEAEVAGPSGFRGRLVLALEGAFANEAPARGDQIVFGRIRVRASGAVPGATYTVTHPYGVDVLQADEDGFVDFTEDIGGDAGQFGVALGSRVAPFLTFANGPEPPPAGSIGNPAAEQTVTGSPCDANFFEIAGPGLPEGRIRTDQFTVVGKRAFICGNGVLDPDEECDDGNTAAGDCCSPSCDFEPAGRACDDGNPCTVNSTCNGAGLCRVTGSTTLPCDDRNPCTTADRCAAGRCVGGPPPNCDDGNVCTTDACDPATGCVRTNNTAPCDDGNRCTSPDRCAAGVCGAGLPVGCDDGNVCTTDSCSPSLGCQHANNRAACNDANACTTADVCSGAGACLGGPAPNCDDGNPCTDDACDPARGCVHVNNHAPCNDGNACTTADTCAAGSCAGGPSPRCDDGNVCTADACAPATGCVYTNVSLTCDDGNACTTGDHCSAGACLGGPPRDCADTNACTTDTCDPAAGCRHGNAPTARRATTGTPARAPTLAARASAPAPTRSPARRSTTVTWRVSATPRPGRARIPRSRTAPPATTAVPARAPTPVAPAPAPAGTRSCARPRTSATTRGSAIRILASAPIPPRRTAPPARTATRAPGRIRVATADARARIPSRAPPRTRATWPVSAIRRAEAARIPRPPTAPGARTASTASDACADAVCQGTPASGFASVTCILDASRAPALCPGETIPAGVTDVVARVQILVDKAASADRARAARAFLRKAMKKFKLAARRAEHAGQQQRISSACATALRALYLDGRARAESMARDVARGR